MSKVFQRYQAAQKKKAIGMLKALIDRIQRGELIVTQYGFWPTNLDGKVIFRIDTVSRDSEKEISDFKKFS